MGKISLHELAVKNKKKLNQDYDQLMLSLKPDIRKELHKIIDIEYDYTVSVRSGYKLDGADVGYENTSVLLTLLKGRQYKNAWELHPDNKHNRDLLFGKMTNLRHEFDESFINGRLIKYLALNNGKLGPSYWGDFTFSFLTSQFKPENISILKYNSLIKNKDLIYHRYFLSTGEVCHNKLQHDLCTLNDTKKLVILKQDIETLETLTTLEDILIRPINDKHSDYIEVLISEEIKIVKSELRVSENWMDRLLEELEISWSEPSSLSKEIDYFAAILNEINVCEEDGVLKMNTL